MGRGSGDMGHAVRAGPAQEVPERFPGAGQHQRAPAKERAQKNLQAAISPDVVEGAPHRGAGQRVALSDRARQARQRVHDQLRRAGRPGRQEDPLRLMASPALGIGGREPRATRDDDPHAGSAGRRHRPIGHEGIHRRGRDDVRQMLRRQIGRAKNQPSGDAIELDERQGRRQLIAGGDQDGTAAQLLEPTPEARAPDQLAQRDARFGSPQRTVGQVAGGARRAPERAVVRVRHLRKT